MLDAGAPLFESRLVVAMGAKEEVQERFDIDLENLSWYDEVVGAGYDEECNYRKSCPEKDERESDVPTGDESTDSEITLTITRLNGEAIQIGSSASETVFKLSGRIAAEFQCPFGELVCGDLSLNDPAFGVTVGSLPRHDLQVIIMSPLVDQRFCDVCDMWLNGEPQMEDHLIGKKHRKNILSRRRIGRTTAVGAAATADANLAGDEPLPEPAAGDGSASILALSDIGSPALWDQQLPLGSSISGSCSTPVQSCSPSPPPFPPPPPLHAGARPTESLASDPVDLQQQQEQTPQILEQATPVQQQVQLPSPQLSQATLDQSTQLQSLSGSHRRLHLCAHSKNVTKWHICSGCMLVRYCSQQCQGTHWKACHKFRVSEAFKCCSQLTGCSVADCRR
jgi:hypothetical protein